MDECQDGTDQCGPVGTCHNTLGSYECVCPRGYKRDETGTKCIGQYLIFLESNVAFVGGGGGGVVFDPYE